MSPCRQCYAAPASASLQPRSALCYLIQFTSEIDLARIPSRADERAASGMLLKRAAVHLVDLPALFRKATARPESVTDWGGVWWDAFSGI